MSQDSIKHYQKAIRLRFQNEDLEERYHEHELLRGRRSGAFAFSILFLLNLSFSYLEYRAFGVETWIPMFGYLFAAVAALVNALVSQLGNRLYAQNIRLLGNGLLSMAVVMVALSLQKYSGYHALEMSLLVIWLATLNSIRFIVALIVNVVAIVAFLVSLFGSGISAFWMSLVAVILITATVLGGYIAYLLERQRRQLFLHTANAKNMNSRQESWAFTIIDLEMALSGISEFKEMIGLLKRYLEPVIKFESYVLTSLEGQGPKPIADKMEGQLFEDDQTIWSQDLLNKLTQTRHATTSAEYEIVKGLFGMKQQKFTSFRLDVPVFNDSKLLGVISLRRSNEAFDELDTIASFSIATQAMSVYKRTIKNAAMVLDNNVPDPIIRKRQPSEVSQADATLSSASNTQVAKLSSSQNTSMEFTAISSEKDFNNLMAPADLVKKIKQDEESAKKTITLLSRENADKVAMSKYKTAALEGNSLSILIIEVDGLSKLREQDGDQVAYKVFAAIVKYIFSVVEPKKDILGRYGQNGLSVLMPQVDMNAAEKFAEKIRQFVARARYKTAYGEKSATLSIGVAALTDDTGDYASMVKRADMALFVAKKNGRNCVKVRL